MMPHTSLVRQFIKDAAGQPIAVLLPIEEYFMMQARLGKQDDILAAQLHEMQLAASDPLFLADLRETMVAYETADAEWWEHAA